MTGDEAKAIRKRAGLTVGQLAHLMRLSEPRGPDEVRKWERGAKPVSGPASVLLLVLDKTGAYPLAHALDEMPSIGLRDEITRRPLSELIREMNCETIRRMTGADE